MSSDEDLLTGSEMVARAFHKHLRGQPVFLSVNKEGTEAKLRVGNYILTFDDHGEGALVIKDVSGAT